jgi:hypothetical protein
MNVRQSSSNSGPRSKPWKSFSFYWNPVSKTGENIDELRNGLRLEVEPAAALDMRAERGLDERHAARALIDHRRPNISILCVQLKRWTRRFLVLNPDFQTARSPVGHEAFRMATLPHAVCADSLRITISARS